MDIAKLKSDLELDEGLRLHPYEDTVGKLTIGIGRNLDDVGISEAEARHMLGNDIEWVVKELDRAMPWWRTMPEPAQRALANMAFNLGLTRLRRFKNMLAALQAGDYSKAADEALDSLWAKQVKGRADRIAALYRSAAQ
jgi:lysozyme